MLAQAHAIGARGQDLHQLGAPARPGFVTQVLTVELELWNVFPVWGLTTNCV
jgi:hypothetical protein